LLEEQVAEGLRTYYPAAVFSSIPLEDVGESLLGALYLDGGFPAAAATIALLWRMELQNSCAAQKDSKSVLQEFLQERKRGKPIYTELSRTGPDHHPIFQVQVTSPLDEKSALGTGSAKRSAEQAAAAALLQLLQQEESYGTKI
jgi:ribonuclease-3